MPEERLQKILSACGFGSRRDCEKLIADGIVKINNRIAILGDKGDILTDDIRVNGRRVTISNKNKTYIALNKPRRVISNIKKIGDRKTVIDLVDHDGYLFIVGRLDFLSEGLVLLTDDGELANRLTHPRYEHEKEYDVLVKGIPSRGQLSKWRAGGQLALNFKALPCKVKVIKKEGGNAWINVILREGQKRQIREIGRILGLPVIKIIRRRISTLELGNLPPGKWRYLDEDEILSLKKAAHL